MSLHPRTFYIFTGSGSVERGRMVLTECSEDHYWDYRGDIARAWRASDGSVYPSILPPSGHLDFFIESLGAKGAEDMPFSTKFRVVSERLRALLLQFEPTGIFSFPAHIDHRSFPKPPHDYFVVSPTRIVECHDVVKTTWRKDEHPPWAHLFFLDPERVPADAHFFRPHGNKMCVIVSGEVRQAITAAKMRGPRYLDPSYNIGISR
jgi:hypothetical protein